MALLDYLAMQRGFNRHAHNETNLSKTIAQQLLERCLLIKQEPKAILDLGCGTGEFTYRLSKTYPKAKATGIDIAAQRIKMTGKNRPWFNKTRFEVADMTSLPFADNTFDLIVSNLALYWVEDIALACKEIHRVLKPDGVLMFTSLGPDTMQELRMSFAKVDDLPHVNIFLDMHEIGDALLKAGLKDPVMDVDYHKITYPSFETFIQELKDSGEINYHKDRHKGLLGKAKWQQVRAHYESYRNIFGKLPVTYEVIFGHALGTAKISKLDNRGEIHIPISQIKRKS